MFKLATSGEEIEKKYLGPDVLKNFNTLHALIQKQLNNAKIATEEDITQLITQSSKTKQKSTQRRTTSNVSKPLTNTNTDLAPKITKKTTKKPLSKSQKLLNSASLALSKKQYDTAIKDFEKAKNQALTKEEQLAALDGLISAKQKQTLDSLSHINLDYGFAKCNLKDSKLRLSHATDMLFSLETLYKEFDQLGKTKANLDLNRSLLQEDRLKIEEKINQLMLIKAQKLSLKDKKTTPIIPIETYPSSRVIDKSQFPELPLVVENKPKQEVIYNPQHMTVPLTIELQQAFECLKPIKGYHYLVGSMVLRLLEGPQSNIVPTDLDFLSLYSNSDEWIKNGNFKQNSEEKRLLKSTNWNEFTTFRPLEIWLEEDKSLEESLLARDFTIAALACTNEGVIIDPTGFGFDDLAQKRLRMIGDPTLRFEHSPSILLRVIKYRLLDFKIDDNIIKALMAWQPSKSTNLVQLQVLCEKMLKNTNKLVFAAYLITYQLASKIYNLSVELSCDALVALMENNRKHNAAQYKGSFFSNSPSTEEKNLSLEQDNPTQSKHTVNASKFDQSL